MKLTRLLAQAFIIFLAVAGLCSDANGNTDANTDANADANGNQPVRPNIIYIMADDLGYGDLGCYGQKKIKTPELDRLSKNGLRLTQHYAGTAVCAPTRCSLMTGLHTGHCYIRANSPGYPGPTQTPIPEGTETLGTMLQRAGYKTACIGKWGLGSNENCGGALKQGFDFFFGYYDQVHAHNYYPDHIFKNNDRIELDKKTYTHDMMTEEALGFVEANKEQPFFLYLPYCIPHTKFQVPERGAYENTDWKDTHKTQAAMITRMDRDIGRLANRLKELGIDRKTLLIFTSDHGAHGQSGTADFFKASGNLRGVKRSLYEGGIRTPFIAYWPGTIKPERTSDHVSAFWDMMPTFAELAGGKPKTRHDGISMVPTLLGKNDQPKHDFLYWELFEGRKHNRAVRMGKWKGVIPNFYKSQDVELYDLETDESETKDLAAQHPEIVAKIESYIESARVRNPFWNVDAKGFDLEAACIATGVPVPERKQK